MPLQGMENLLQNRLLMSILSGAGASMTPEGSVARAVNPMVQQNISAKNFMDMLQQFLGEKNIPGGKAVVGDKGVTLDIPASELGKMTMAGPGVGTEAGAEGFVPAPSAAGGFAGLGGAAGLEKIDMMSLLNPSASPLGEFTSADLAGLTPEMISQALQFKFAKEEIGQKKISDVVDLMYKGRTLGMRARELNIEESKLKAIEADRDLDRQLKRDELDYRLGKMTIEELNAKVDRLYTVARTKKELSEVGLGKERVDIDRPYKGTLADEAAARTAAITPSITVPGTDIKLTGDQYIKWQQIKASEKTPLIKNYEYAVERKQYSGNIMDFDDLARTTSQKDYDRYAADETEAERIPKGFHEWYLERVKAGHKPPQVTPVNWSTATKELTKRFGKMDPTGVWAVTPELQTVHRKAQERLVELKTSGTSPLHAVNEAENQARDWIDNVERRYYEYIAAAQNIKSKGDREDRISKVKSEFFRNYKYVPPDRKY